MADFATTSPQIIPYNPNQGMETLQGVLGLRARQLDIQAGQQKVQQQAIETQKQNQMQGERSFLTNMMSTGKDDQGNSILGTDGEPDPMKAIPAISRRMPLTGQGVLQSIIQTEKDKVGLQAASTDLDMKHRQNLQGIVQAGGSSDDINSGIDQYVSQHPEAKTTAGYLKDLVQHLDKTNDPVQRNKAVQTIASKLQVGSPVPTQATPTTVETGGRSIQGTTAPAAQGGGFTPSTAINKEVPPGAVVVNDAFGRPNVVNPQTATTRPVGGPGFTAPVADQPAIMSELREARAATSHAGVTRNVNQHLLDLSDETKTGPGTPWVQYAAASLGMPSGSRYQEISAYLDRQAALQAQVMGVPNTNAGLAAAERATGTTEYTPQALREKVKFFDSLNSGAMAYRQGLDKAVGTGPTPDLSKYQAFRSAWTRNFDPDIYRAEDAQRRGDTRELADLKRRLGPNGMRDLAQKSANLRMLEQGQVPQ